MFWAGFGAGMSVAVVIWALIFRHEVIDTIKREYEYRRDSYYVWRILRKENKENHD